MTCPYGEIANPSGSAPPEDSRVIVPYEPKHLIGSPMPVSAFFRAGSVRNWVQYFSVVCVELWLMTRLVSERS